MRILALFLLAAAAQAQVAQLVPEVARMPAPDWVKPGVRLTWFSADGTSQGEYITRVPKGKGDVKDDKGRHAKRHKGGGAGGMGYKELFVVAVEPGKVVVEVRFYLLPGTTPSGPATLATMWGGVSTTPGAVGPYWVHPNALAKLQRDGHAGYKIVAGKHKDNGTERDALFVSTGDAKDGMTWAYDLASGVLLARSSSATGRTGLGGRMEDGTDLGGGWRATEFMRFREYTQLKLPWVGQAPPAWLATTRRIEFGGHWKFTDPRTGGHPNPSSQRFDKIQHGKTWALFRHTLVPGPRSLLDGGTLRGMPIEPRVTAQVSGDGSLCGMWIPPAAIAGLTRGQVLAKNPITGITTSVFFVGPDRGQDICVIRWENALQVLDYVYSRKSGGLIRVVSDNRAEKRMIVAVMEHSE